MTDHSDACLLMSQIITRLYRHAALNALDDLYAVSGEVLNEMAGVQRYRWLTAPKTAAAGKRATRRSSRRSQDSVTTRIGRGHPDESEQLIEFEVSGPASTLPDAFWDGLAHALVHMEDNVRRLIHGSVDRLDGDTGMGWLSTDGVLLEADQSFVDHFKKAEPGWQETADRLPIALPEIESGSTRRVTWRNLVLNIVHHGKRLQLMVHADRRVGALTERELSVAQLVARGYTFKEVAAELDISPSTAASHLYNAYRKLGISKRSELVAWLEWAAPPE